LRFFSNSCLACSTNLMSSAFRFLHKQQQQHQHSTSAS
jgi:hypothetical protein